MKKDLCSAFLLNKIPQHLDERIWKGVQIDVEFALCRNLASEFTKSRRGGGGETYVRHR
jgi:hypothetical protein